MRICKKCQETRDESDFPIWGNRKTHTCRTCQNKAKVLQRRKTGVLGRKERNEYMRKYRTGNMDTIIATAIKSRKANPLPRLWRQLLTRKDCLRITREEFMTLSVPKECPVLGIPITFDLTRDNIPSVDRIDPNRPYERGNIAIISYRANMIKSIGSASEHRRISEWMESRGNPAGKSIGGSPVSVGAIYVKFGRKRERISDVVSPVCM